MKISTDNWVTTIDLSNMPVSDIYENTYGEYLKVFEMIAKTPMDDKTIQVINAPYSWHPLLRYLGAECVGAQSFFKHDTVVQQMLSYIDSYDRTLIEVLCGFRPECVDALWKCDMEWKTDRPSCVQWDKFVITTYSGFWRPEILRFMEKLDTYKTTAKCAVVVPCAADKPYPSPLHEQVKSMMPNEWDLLVSTTALGLVPESMWDGMPNYDSGLPYEWRLYERAVEFFKQNHYDHIIFYVDFGSEVLWRVADALYIEYKFVNEVKPYNNYLDLMDSKRLDRLQEAIDLPQLLEEQEARDANSN